MGECVLNKTFKKKLLLSFAYILLGIWVAFSVLPVVWIYLSSFKLPEEAFQIPPKLFFKPTLYNYKVLFGLAVPQELEGVAGSAAVAAQYQFVKYFLNSILVCSISTIFSLSIGTLAAYSFTRFRFKGSRAILLGILIARMIPPITLVIPYYILMRKLGLLDTQMSLIFTYLSFTVPFTVWMMRGFFMSIPKELDEAAIIDGCSRISAFFRIILPLVAPGLAATSIFALITSWNEFLYSSILVTDSAKTLTPAIASFVTDKAILWGKLYAASGVVLLPVLVFSIVVQKHLVRGLTFGAVKS